LDGQFVVLSACSTAAVSVPFRDNAFAGLPSAFLYAGAGSVLVTLWPIVSNDTPIFTYALFSALTTGTPAAQALRTVQWESAMTKHGADLRHPSTWAAFSIIGGRAWGN
jgi:CHAT domain-containing protein